MRAAADGEDGSLKHVAMENRLYPMRELLGDLLLEIGQPAAAPDGSEPDVAWQCTFADVAARDAILKARERGSEARPQPDAAQTIALRPYCHAMRRI
jgi:hypothetical protein